MATAPAGPCRAGARQEIHFGRNQNDAPYLGEGWSRHADGFRWMIGARSHLWLEHPGPAYAYVLDMDLRPFTAADLTHQSLSIRARNERVFSGRISKPGPVSCILPHHAIADPGPVHITFDHQDAAAPSAYGDKRDDRFLAFQIGRLSLTPIYGEIAHDAPAPLTDPVARANVPPLTGMAPEDFSLCFESLGNNCEFGLVQRHCGAEPLSLLRFANFSLVPLLRALRDQFVRIGTPEDLTIRVDPNGRHEFLMFDASYHMGYHTFQFEGETTAAEVLSKQPARQKFLARKLLEDLEEGTKIFVIRRNPPLELHEVLSVFSEMRSFGPGKLLWVTLAPEGKPAGQVVEVLPGLYRGELDRLAPDSNAPDLSLGVWLQMLVNTWRLAQAASHAG